MEIKFISTELNESVVRGSEESTMGKPPFQYHIRRNKHNHWTKRTIPVGATSDGSSVPWFGRWIINRRKRRWAAWVHDDGFKRPGNFSMWEWNRIYLIVAVMPGPNGQANRFQAFLSGIGLTLGSWYPWGKHRQNDKK